MKLKKSIGVLLLISVIIGSLLVPVADVGAQAVSPQAYLDGLMSRYNKSGVAFVTKNGKVIAQSSSGMANTKEGKEMTMDTMFPIGSLSKQFCAVAIYMLKEQGKISFDDKLSEYFPDYTAAKDVTIRHLLTMRSGIREFQEGAFVEFIPTTTGSQEENHQIILDWLNTKRLIFKPGGGYDYSNTNTLLLSMIIEQITEESYENFVKENIFAPLDMNRSGFYEELVNHSDLCEFLFPEPPNGALPTDTKGCFQGSGDLVSTSKDMDKWLTSLREYKLISKESTEDLLTVYTTNAETYNGIGVGYANSLMVAPDGAVLHGGFILAYSSAVLTYFEEGLNVFVVNNDVVNTSLEMEEVALIIGAELKNLSVYGDVTMDMEVNVKDATLIQKVSAELETLSERERLCADVNGDTVVNIKDSTAIQKYIAMVETNIPVGEFVW